MPSSITVILFVTEFITANQVRIQDLCKEWGQARFCRHHAAELWRQQKFVPQNWRSGGGGGGGPGP